MEDEDDEEVIQNTLVINQAYQLMLKKIVKIHQDLMKQLILMELMIRNVHSNVKKVIHTIHKRILVKNQDETIDEEVMMKK